MTARVTYEARFAAAAGSVTEWADGSTELVSHKVVVPGEDCRSDEYGYSSTLVSSRYPGLCIVSREAARREGSRILWEAYPNSPVGASVQSPLDEAGPAEPESRAAPWWPYVAGSVALAGVVGLVFWLRSR